MKSRFRVTVEGDDDSKVMSYIADIGYMIGLSQGKHPDVKIMFEVDNTE